MKVSKFVNMLEENGVLVAHSSLYNVAIRVSGETADTVREILTTGNIEGYEDSDLVKDMIKHGFLVENNSDEDATANYLISNVETPLQIIMIVTRQCNFRCPYCYENHENKVMQKDTYDATISFIQDYMRVHPHRQIYISFFGGEPLLEKDNMIAFMEKLNEVFSKDLDMGRIFIRGHATTNGYLLSPQNLKALNHVGIKDFQITIDGLEEDHNRTRMLVNGQGTWRTIMSNLSAAKNSDLDLDIQLRTNYSYDMLDGMEGYFRYLEENFGQDKRFHVYFEAVKNLGVGTSTDTEFLNSAVCNNSDAVEDKLLKMLSKYHIRHKLFANSINVAGLACYSSRNDSFTIDYNGNILKCTVKIDEPYNVVGNVHETQKIIPEKIAKWTSYYPGEKCRNCSIFPICCGKKCPINYDMQEKCMHVKSFYFSVLKNLCIYSHRRDETDEI